jgi:hypothetical protein
MPVNDDVLFKLQESFALEMISLSEMTLNIKALPYSTHSAVNTNGHNNSSNHTNKESLGRKSSLVQMFSPFSSSSSSSIESSDPSHGIWLSR